LRLHTATDDNRQLPEAIQLGHRAMAMIAYPQGLTALLARLFQRGQRDRVRRFGTRGSGSSDHAHSPAELFILLLAFLQPTPAVKLSFPFREKNSPKNECLENACLFWLPMLHYQHSRLNGWGCPFGIPTKIRGGG